MIYSFYTQPRAPINELHDLFCEYSQHCSCKRTQKLDLYIKWVRVYLKRPTDAQDGDQQNNKNRFGIKFSQHLANNLAANRKGAKCESYSNKMSYHGLRWIGRITRLYCKVGPPPAGPRNLGCLVQHLCLFGNKAEEEEHIVACSRYHSHQYPTPH